MVAFAEKAEVGNNFLFWQSLRLSLFVLVFALLVSVTFG